MLSPKIRFLLAVCFVFSLDANADNRYLLPGVLSDSLLHCEKCLLLAEQSGQRIAIVDMSRQRIVWEWQAGESNIKPEAVQWFSNISDVKAVYGGRYLLVSASGGGVALIRIRDKMAVFYAYAGGNTHSAELLPDGNIVAASSTGNYLTVFCTDTVRPPDAIYKKTIPIEFGHNVVWDRKNKLLWSAAMNTLKAFRYNYDKRHPDLILEETIPLPGTEAHDLFPVFAEHALWLTNTSGVYQIDTDTRKIKATAFSQPNIKSVSSGPAGYPVIIVRPTQSWWTDTVLDTSAAVVFSQKGLKIYKARWLVENTFSYTDNPSMK